MARFVWRLQKVLDVKKRLEDLKKAELLRLAEQIAQARAILWAQQRIVQQICQQVGSLGPSDRPLQQACLMRHVWANDEKIDQILSQIRDLEARQRQVTEQLLEIRRSREALEKLREKAQQRFRQQQDRLEQKQLDDVAAVAFVRWRREATEGKAGQVSAAGEQG